MTRQMSGQRAVMKHILPMRHLKIDGKLKEEQMDRLFLEIEMPLVFTLFDMEQAGVRIEAEELKNMENNWANRSYSWNPRFTRWQGRILTSILRNSWV